MDTQKTTELVTVKEAAQRLAISRRTLERLVMAGQFPPPLKLGHASRVLVSDIERYIATLVERRGESYG